jgi:hypothetical protein
VGESSEDENNGTCHVAESDDSEFENQGDCEDESSTESNEEADSYEEKEEEEEEAKTWPINPLHPTQPRRKAEDAKLIAYSQKMLKHGFAMVMRLREKYVSGKPKELLPRSIQALLKIHAHGPDKIKVTRTMEAVQAAWDELSDEQQRRSNLQHQYALVERTHLVHLEDHEQWGMMDFINFARDAHQRRHCFPTTAQRLQLQMVMGLKPSLIEELITVGDLLALTPMEHGDSRRAQHIGRRSGGTTGRQHLLP